MLSSSDIFKIKDRVLEELFIPEWSTTVWIRVMSSRLRDQWEIASTKKDYKNMRAKIAVLTVCDKEGNLVFSEGDVEALGEKSALALSRIFDVATRLNGYSEVDVNALSKN